MQVAAERKGKGIRSGIRARSPLYDNVATAAVSCKRSDSLSSSGSAILHGPLDQTYALTYSLSMATKVIPKTELRERIRHELSGLSDDSLLITERGRPLAVVVSVARWNELQETVEELEDAVAILEHRGRTEPGRPAEAVFSALEAEELDVPRSARQTG